MKAFVVVALLVASVAARSLDVDTLRLMKEKSLLKDDLLLKEKLIGGRFQLPKKTILGEQRYPMTVGDVDYTTGYGMDYPTTTYGTWGQIGQRRVNILSIEELVATPLFREYYNIPLFRQFLEQYPVVFRQYIESVLFQQFWTMPAFQQYFRNPVLFYKYIVPQVQVVAQTIPEQGIYGQEYNQYKNFDLEGRVGGGIEQYLNRNVYPEGREVVVGDYLNRIFNGFQQQNKYTVPLAREFYGQGQQYFGRNQINTPVNYKFLLDRIYKTLFVDQPTGEVTQVRTDVKVAPAQREVVVEPITGQTKVVVEQPRIVDVKVDEKVIPRTQVDGQVTVEGELVKETLLKKLLLTKVITPEVYEILKTLPVAEIERLVQQRGVQGDLVKETLLRKLLLTKVITPEVYEILKTLPVADIERLVLAEQGVQKDLVKETLLKKLLLTKVITPEVYEILKTLPIEQIERLVLSRQGVFGGLVTRRDILGELETPYVTREQNIFGDLETPFVTRRDVFGRDQVYGQRYNQFNQIYNNQVVGDRVTPVLRDLLNIYGQQTVRDQVVPTRTQQIFDEIRV